MSLNLKRLKRKLDDALAKETPESLQGFLNGTASSHNEPLTGKVEMEKETPRCSLCGEPMPPGEEMFKFHGYSGDCPKPPLSAEAVQAVSDHHLLLGLKNTERLMKEKAALESSLSRAQERLKEAADIMMGLIDVQNGCPLEKYRDAFEETNARAREFIHRLATEDKPEKE